MTDAQRATLLVELGCEELPPKALDGLAQAFLEGVCQRLNQAGLRFDEGRARALYSPRRLAVLLPDVPASQPDREIERRGPALSAAFDDGGRPTRAAEGFARSVGVAVSELDTLRTDKGEWLYCRVFEPGQPLDEFLYPALQAALDGLPVPRPMRWADHDFSFVRPVHWLVVLHGERVVDGSLYGKTAGRESRGHRVHHPDPVVLSAADDYLSELERAHVLADPVRRSARIEASVREAAKDAAAEARITDALLAEVNNLVEWPVPVVCSFDTAFLEVPHEALVASMEDHQKFFPLLDADSGALKPSFVAVANLDSRDVAAVRAGFERVIRPRLADAQFFWEQDLKRALDEDRRLLDDIVYQEKIGSVGDKSNRMASFSEQMAAEFGIDPTLAARAAQLSKCDLVSQMVGEFPELQGTMGAHYAAAAGEAPTVSAAVGEHYAPRFSGDQLPPSPAGRLLALADRLDTLLGIFAAGLKPTGNRDPFALRRSALGVVRLVTEGGLDHTLDRLLAASADTFPPQIDISAEIREEVKRFVLDRARQYYRDQGFDTRQVNAALAAPLSTLQDLQDRLVALKRFMAAPEASALVAANKRIGNILRKSESEVCLEIDEEKLILGEESALFDEVARLEATLPDVFDRGDYAAGLAQLARLDGVVDAFFDQVMVMDEDLEVRANRLALLRRLKGLFDRVADFSQAA